MWPRNDRKTIVTSIEYTIDCCGYLVLVIDLELMLYSILIFKFKKALEAGTEELEDASKIAS